MKRKLREKRLKVGKLKMASDPSGKGLPDPE